MCRGLKSTSPSCKRTVFLLSASSVLALALIDGTRPASQEVIEIGSEVPDCNHPLCDGYRRQRKQGDVAEDLKGRAHLCGNTFRMASASHRDAWLSTPLNKWCRVSRRITGTLSSFPEVRAWPENAGYPAARVILATRRVRFLSTPCFLNDRYQPHGKAHASQVLQELNETPQLPDKAHDAVQHGTSPVKPNALTRKHRLSASSRRYFSRASIRVSRRGDSRNHRQNPELNFERGLTSQHIRLALRSQETPIIRREVSPEYTSD